MRETLFWLYLANAVVIINHEIESAYWREWELFRLPGGITGFLIIHFPVLFVMLYGLPLLKDGGAHRFTPGGLRRHLRVLCAYLVHPARRHAVHPAGLAFYARGHARSLDRTGRAHAVSAVLGVIRIPRPDRIMGGHVGYRPNFTEGGCV